MAVATPSWENWQANMTHTPSGSAPSSRARRDYYDNFASEIAKANASGNDALAKAIISDHSLGPAPSAPSAPSSSGGGGGGAPAPYQSPYPSDYGLDGKVDKINTGAMHLDPWENVDVPWDPLYLDQYEEWAKEGFINRDVQKEDTVQWQMDNLLDKQSRYITSARQRGTEQAAGRGLLNSSIAAGTAERAAIDAALPIAQQDASTYFSQGINNQNLANQFALARQNAGMTGMMEMDKLKQGLEAEFAKFNAEMDVKVESFNSTMDFEEAMDRRAQAQAEKLARASAWAAIDTAHIGGTYSLAATNVQAASAERMNYQDNMMKIWGDPNITPQQSAVWTDQLKILAGYSGSSAVNYSEAFT